MYEFMAHHWESPGWRHEMFQHMYGRRPYGMHSWMYGNGGGGWGWLWITLCVLVGLALVAAVAYGAARLART